MSESIQAFILQYTRLKAPSLLPEVQLHLAQDVMEMWRLTELRLGEANTPLPFWAVAWVGGQAVARYVLDHADVVRGKRVVDVASGSGVAAIAAARAGAAYVTAFDTDDLAGEAVAVNARVNGVQVHFCQRDLLEAEVTGDDVVLAGDVCYEQPMADHVLGWLRSVHTAGIRVLLGDPGREYFTASELVCLAEYDVRTPRDVEGVEVRRSGVYTFERRSSPAQRW